MRALLLALLVACTPSYDPPTTAGDLRYPRLAAYEANELFAVAPLGIAAAETDSAAIVERNPAIELLARLHTGTMPVDGAIAKVPTAAWQLGPGSTTVGMTMDTATRIRVADPTVFTAPADLLVGSEHVHLVAIEADELIVERGFAGSTPQLHSAGTAIAPHIVIDAGAGTSWAIDVTNAAWQAIVVADATALVMAGPWQGVVLEACADAMVTMVRAAIGDDAVLLGEGACAQTELDGIVLAGIVDFDAVFMRYLRDPVSVVRGAQRFELAVALLGDGYFAPPDLSLPELAPGPGWLGLPQGPATRVAGGAYVRTFTRGMVLANPTVTPLHVTVPPGFRKLDGEEVTGGMLVVTARDGALLSR